MHQPLKLEPVAFCYWLQGAIEIADLTTFDKAQARFIMRVLTTMETHTIFTLQALLLIGSLPPDEAFVYIQRELQEMFIHEIDNSYEGDQEFFHLAHRGEVEVLTHDEL